MKFYYEDAAKRGDPMPDGLTLVEKAHYQAIAALTTRYIHGGISAEQSIKEKRSIDKAAEDAIFDEDYVSHCANLWKDIEYAAYKVRESGTEYDGPVGELMGIIYGLIRYTKEEREKHQKELAGKKPI